MRLHVLNTSTNMLCINDCLKNILQDDILLLIEDGVNLLRTQQITSNISLKALTCDVQARQIETEKEQIDFAQWVEITEQAQSIIHWF